MKLWIMCCLVAVAAARPYSPSQNVEVILNDNYNPGGNKGFKTTYELSDGTLVQAQGKLVNVVNDGKEVQTLVISGKYTFYVDGVKYTVRYTADENGYHPEIIEGTPPPPGAPPLNVNNCILASICG